MKKVFFFLAAVLLATNTAQAQVTLGTSSSATNPERSGDATTGLFSPAAGAVAISSAGTEIMRANGTGLGVGTSSPAYALDVNGEINIESNNILIMNGCSTLTRTGSSGGVLNINGTGCTDSVAIYPGSGASTPSIYVQNSSGNVGIGTSSPANPLSVNGVIQSLSGGFKFPDGTVQTTAGSSTASTSGSTTLPGGIIFQWGYVTGGSQTVSFPTAFPNNCFNVQVTSNNSGTNSAAAVNGLSTSGFNLTQVSGISTFWFAIGN